jgi:hypothetical protein
LSSVPSYTPAHWSLSQGVHDNETTRGLVENTVMALACDLTRTISIDMNVTQDPRFPWQYFGDTAAATAGFSNWHDMVHLGQVTAIDRLAAGFRFYAEVLARLLDRLSEVDDGAGTKLIDNTLVLWMSDFGNGGQHRVVDIPVVLAGLRGRLIGNQYLRFPRHTTGDLFATVLNSLGETDTTFGNTGFAQQIYADWLGDFASGYPLHKGLLSGLL